MKKKIITVNFVYIYLFLIYNSFMIEIFILQDKPHLNR